MRRLITASILAAIAASAPAQRQRAAIASTTATPIGAQQTATEPTPVEMVTDFPRLSDPVVVTNETGGGTWHWKDGVARDNFGDGQMGIVRIGDRLFYLLVARTGTPPVAGAVWLKLYDGDPYHWPAIPKEPPKFIPGIPERSITNIDTHAFAQNPHSWLITFIHSARPGWLKAQPFGSDTYAVQRATTNDPSGGEGAFLRFPEQLVIAPNMDVPWQRPWKHPFREEWFGGPQESSIVIDPPNAYIFGEFKTSEAPDDFGQRFRGRIFRAVCPLEDLDADAPFVVDPHPVWEPTEHPLYGKTNATAVWGTANMTPRAHVFRLMDGSYHMLYIGARPAKKRDGTPANGAVNRSVGIGHLWSHEEGREGTWHHDTNNPLIDWDSLGWSDIGVANRLNSPFGFQDPRTGRVFIGVWGNEIGEQNKLGTRLYLCEVEL